MNPSQPPWWADQPAEDHRPPAARGRGSRRGFGHTWWGAAWVEALEQRAGLNTGRLSRGRSYARRGAVRSLEVTTGLVLASVQGTRPLPYSVTVRVPAFRDEEWDRVLDVIGAQLGRTAALLDGELPPEVAADVRAAGLDLLPSTGDVVPRCACPDVAEPCKHSAAVCYLVADTLDEDPFALFRLRGRSRMQVLDALRARRTAVSPRSTGATGSASTAADRGPDDAASPDGDGVVAREAYARSDSDRPEIPAPVMPPPKAGRPAALALDPPPEAGVDPAALSTLAADAAVRAWQLATGDDDGGLRLSADEDVARRAAAVTGTPALGELASRFGLSTRELTGWAIAWRHGGRTGLEVHRDPWQPPADALAAGRAALVAALDPPGDATDEAVSVSNNRVTCGRYQLRLGTDRLWYPFVASFGGWDLAGPGAPDPADAIAALRAST